MSNIEFDIINQEEETPKKESPIQEKAPKRTIMSRVFETRNLLFLFFLVALAAAHIANNHLVEKSIREVGQIERDIERLRWEYMTGKAELMFKSKQSEVAKEVESLGLYELSEPPYTIKVDEEDIE